MIEPRQVPVRIGTETIEIDRDIVNIVKAMNRFPGIRTVHSCSGHGDQPIAIWFEPESFDDMPPMLYYFDACHSGVKWNAYIYTDCGAAHVSWLVESINKGPHAYMEGNKIARCMENGEGWTV